MASTDDYSFMKRAFINKDALKKGDYEEAWTTFNKQLNAVLNIEQKATTLSEESCEKKMSKKIAVYSERDSKAKEYLKKMVDIAEKNENKILECYALNFLGRYCNQSKQYTDALQCFQKNVVFANEVKNKDLQGRAYIGMGYAYFKLEKYKFAIKCYQNGLKNAKETKNGSRALISYAFAGRCHVAEGNWDDALHNFMKAMEKGGEIGKLPPDLLCSILSGVGFSYLQKGRHDEAIANLIEAIGIASKISDHRAQAESLIHLSEAHFKVGNSDEAMAHINLALKIARNCGDDELIGRAEALKNENEKKPECKIEEKEDDNANVVDEKIESQIVEAMVCPICLEIAEEAVETSCCHHVYCERCLSLVRDGPCPQCRRSFEIVTSHVSRRIIGNLPAICSFAGCKAKICRSEIRDHEARCEHRLYICPAPKCLFEGLKKNFLAHLTVEHEDAIVKFSQNLFAPAPCEASREQAGDDDESRIKEIVNEAGQLARLGATGKHYCGQVLNGPKCKCCDNQCGPLNGCNCAPCMKLDIQSFKLKKGWFVNREGCICKQNTDTGDVYCGRLVFNSHPYPDAFCGPEAGPNCPACRTLQSQIEERYADVWD